VLHSLDLDIEQGSLVALLGSSGCGKTTLLRAIAGFNPVAAGQIRLNGATITALPPERRRMALRGWARILLRRSSDAGFLRSDAHDPSGRSASVLENPRRAAPRGASDSP
jgi:ABC-type branched-subunit amino acid transport system ATPase component